MVSWLCYLIGVDFAQIKSGKDILLAFTGLILFVLSLAAFGFYYAIYNTTESLFLGIIVATFFTLLILNIYRLVFSISEGELTKYDNFWNVTIFVLKRGFILIALSLFISKSLEVYIFKNQLEIHVNKYKNGLKRDFNRTLDIGLLKERQSIDEEYERRIYDDKLFGKFSSENMDKYALERDQKLIEIQKKVDIKNYLIQQKIDASNFFITKIKLLFTYIPQSWLLTLMIISFFLSPFYVFLLTPLFTEYDTSCANASRQIIIDEYNSFKELYSMLMMKSMGRELKFVEKYKDPPFNTVRVEPSYRVLKKGSLLKWIEMFK
jgi:hypothetical protein